MGSPDRIYIVGTFDTKGPELRFVRDRLFAEGLPTTMVDVSTASRGSDADVSADAVAAFHPNGEGAVFQGDRGPAMAAMTTAFGRFLAGRTDVGAVIGLGGSGGTAIITPAMRGLQVGVPKLMVSTMASGPVAHYVGSSDIAMLYPVTSVAGLNRIARRVLSNAAGAIGGAFRSALHPVTSDDARPALGLTMFGVTTTCVQAVAAGLEEEYDCVVFHATGTGGTAMERLLDEGWLAGLLDLTTTEVCDLLFGGNLACTEDRFGAVARTGKPYVGSCGALDMINFGARASLPQQHGSRLLYEHNAAVTLMRTTPEENIRIGRWIGDRLNQCEGEVRFLLPLQGVSALDRPGQPFHDTQADAALFDSLRDTVHQTGRRRLVEVPAHINEPAFVTACIEQFRQIAGEGVEHAH